MIEPRYDSSLEFLRRWCSEGPWVLTAIGLDRKGIDTRTFGADAEEELRRWLEVQGANRNIYFHVNPVLRDDLTKKARREDTRGLAWLHVDIDPRVGEDIDEEQARALRLLREPPGDVPPPTAIVFSGGGYQGFWRLETEFPINGQQDAFEEAARYNMQLEILFGADNCHNVDRIMRLPGTVNRPDEKKRAKGRRPALAEVVQWRDDRVYKLEQFQKAPKVQTGDAGFTGGMFEVSGNVERLTGVDDPRLQGVHDLAKVVIVQGCDPDNPRRFGKDGGSELDRSAALHYVCCELVRGGVDDDTIYAIITDPGFRISDSVLDKGTMQHKYAIRQIERAREKTLSPELEELNGKHAVIANWGGKCRILQEVWDPVMERHRLTKQSFEDFRNRYMNRTVVEQKDDDVKVTPLGQWWLRHSHRRQYESLVFAPGQEVDSAYNLWRGFTVPSKPGDCSLFKQHLLENVCRGNEEHYAYLWGWMANAVQHPDRPGHSAVVMRGGQGVGKSFVAKTLGHLFGRHFMQVSNPSHLVGNFNAHLRDCVVLFGDEAFYAGDKKHESVLKMLITEDMLVIEPKGVDAEMSTNCVHLMMASNDDWVVPAGLDDRRFFVLDVSPEHKEDTKYFGAIAAQLQGDGYAALLYELLGYDLSEFNVRRVPKTRALQEQKMHSMNHEQEWWFTKLRQGVILIEDNGWERDVSAVELQNDFVQYTRSFNMSRRGNSTKLGQALKSFMPDGYPKQEQRATPIEVTMPDGNTKMVKRPYYYVMPSLEDCRAHWDDNFGGPYDWTKPLDDSPIPDEIPF